MRRVLGIARRGIVLGVLIGLAPVVATVGAQAALPSPGLRGQATNPVILYAAPAGVGTCATVLSPCGLDTALMQAHSIGGQAATIVLARGTYAGVSATVVLGPSAPVTIEGSAATATATVLEGATAASVVDLSGTGTFTLRDVTLQGGAVGAQYGGCISDTARSGGIALRIEGVTLHRCSAQHDGGAIFVGAAPSTAPRAGGPPWEPGQPPVPKSTLVATDVSFTTDSASTGGAVYVATRQATLDDDVFAGDHATWEGGAVTASGGSLRVQASAFSDDTATFSAGGLEAEGQTGTVSVSGSTFTTDSTGAFGGALVDDGVPVALRDDTFMGDHSDTAGALTVTYGALTARFDTFSHDMARRGGAIWITTVGTVDVAASIFQTATCGVKGTGTLTDGGYNVASTTSCTSAPTSQGTSSAIHLATSVASGTPAGPGTLAIGADSSAFEAVPVPACTEPTDERGLPRPGVAGQACDAGAYEAQLPDVALTQTSPTTAAVGAGAGYAGQLTMSGAGASTGPVTYATTSLDPTVTVSPGGAIAVAAGARPGIHAVSGTASAAPFGHGTWSFALTVGGSGYDLVGSDGGVFVFLGPGQTGGFYGSLPAIGVVPAAPVVGMVATGDDQGYFLVGADGGVFAFGDAPFLGSAGQITPRVAPGGANAVVPSVRIVGLVPTGTDTGYLLVGADGGVFAFGTAHFEGSLPGVGVHVSDVIGIASTPSGSGYWVVQATGTVTGFGAAQSFATGPFSSPVTSIAGTATGGGFWLVTATGGVAPYGHASGKGTLPAIGVTPTFPIVGLVPVATGTGYLLVGADGGVFAFGTAPFTGSLPGLVPPVVVSDIVAAIAT